ncbi:MAG: T9SS type A sorting domain-containing protein [Ignavibacteria bacterium]|nr:T9SS type A sorting domain-containing protein [Ignavibacteria bacterium]
MRTTFLNVICFFLLQLIIVSQSNSQSTDEYGSTSVNRVLANLGPGKYAAAEHNFVLNQNLQGTIEAWVYLTSYNINNSCIFEKGSSFLFGVGTAFVFNRPILRIGNTVLFPQTGDAMPLNRWVHLAASWQQVGGNITAAFYIDGLLTGSQTQAASLTSNSDSVTIGGSRLQPNSFVNGFVDEVRYWNRARAGSEIARARFCGVGDGPVANQNSALVSAEDYAGLVSSWTFNESAFVCSDNISLRHALLRGGALQNISGIPGQPIPYNLALYFPGGASDHIRIPDNNIFDRTSSGTIDAWINPNNGTTNSTIISKGAAVAEITFRLYLSGNNLNMSIGAFSIQGPQVPFNTWSHVAVTWSFTGAMCTMKFYVNGVLTGPAVNTMTMGINSNPVYIGNSQLSNSPFTGYMDEIRLWNRDLTGDEIRTFMFNSAKTGALFFQTNLLACWNFEGNLNNTTSITEINATFNIGTTNSCRFSGYQNESITGPITNSFVPHCSVINRRDGDNAFPVGYSMRAPGKNLIYNTNTYDTIIIPGNVNLSDIEVFLSVNQPYINNTLITLTAPNLQERILFNGAGGPGGSILTFLKDGSPALNSFNNPWSYIAAPQQPMGTFGNTNVQGRWILKIFNNALGYTGKLLGWGLRINNSVSGIHTISDVIPSKYKLHQNYPNPFNPSTNIKFDLPFSEIVKISVYDITGKEVSILADKYQEAGSYEINFDGSMLSSGTYFYKLTAGNFTDIRKMVLIK